MNDHSIAEKITEYIDSHLEDELSLDSISDALHYSKYYTARAFREQTGTTIYKYIQEQRLSLAAWKLARTDKPIIEIAYEAHYTSQQAFMLAFRRLYHCTPQIYRKNTLKGGMMAA